MKCRFYLVMLALVLIIPVSTAVAAPKVSPYINENEIVNELRKANIDWQMAKGETIVAGLLSDTNVWALQDMGMIDLFQELTGIRVVTDIFEETELRQKTQVDLLAKTGIFDIVMVDPMYIRTYALADSIVDLDVFINDPKLFNSAWFKWPNDFPEGFREMGVYEGKTYGIPMSISGTLFYYNKKEFKDCGLDPNKPPKTFEELEECAKKLHAPERNLAGIGLRGLRGGGLNVFIWSSFLKSYGGQWFDENWEPMLDSKEAVESIATYARLLRVYGPPGYTNWEWSKIMTAMAQGNIAMTVDAPTFVMTVEDTEKSKTMGQWGYAVQPAGPNGPTMVPYSWYLSINKASRHKTAAWLFAQFMLSEPVQVAIGGPLVCTGRISVLENPIWEAQFSWVEEWREALLENLEYADPDARPRIPEWAEIGDVMGIELQAAIAGSKTPEQAAKDANKKIREIMSEAGYYNK
jgi:multiple sugar transport system substrate-binding protein